MINSQNRIEGQCSSKIPPKVVCGMLIETNAHRVIAQIQMENIQGALQL